MVDLRFFATADMTAETCRTLLRELLVFLNDISALAAQCGGTIVTISGTVLVIGWNVRLAGDSISGGNGGGGPHASNTSGRPHGSMHRSFSPRQRVPGERRLPAALPRPPHKNAAKVPKVRFSVLSGVCEQGVVGSQTQWVYVVTGNLVLLGRVFLEGARLHDVGAVADTATFLRVDAQQFRKRALEVMGLYADEHTALKTLQYTDGLGSNNSNTDKDNSGVMGLAAALSDGAGDLASFSASNRTVAYELTLAGAEANDYAQLWNAAFEDYCADRAEEAARKLATWRQLFGDRPTLRRALRILGRAAVDGRREAACLRPIPDHRFEYCFII